MESMNENNYSMRYSYLKIIMELLGNKKDEMVLGAIINRYALDLNDEEISRLYILSALFENRLLNMDKDKRMEFIKFLYECYVKSMIIHFSNGNYETANMFYRLLEDKVKEISGFYGIYGENTDRKYVLQ